MTHRPFDGRRCALIIGHPGHELRVWGWMRAVRPLVAVLTDGGGHHGRDRLALSRRVCEQAGATASDHFGLLSDAAAYEAILRGDSQRFVQAADALGEWIIATGIEVVAGDAVEGYNPMHDLCRAIIDRAVRRAATFRVVENFAFDLTGAPTVPPAGAGLRFDLSPDDLAAKLAVCQDYGSAVGGTLSREIGQLLRLHGSAPFATEYLRPHDAWRVDDVRDEPPFYETYGAKRVAEGLYQDVIRHDAHLVPIFRALRQ